MSRNLIICFDGTWNTPDNDGDIDGNTNTNVRLFYEALNSKTAEGQKQLKWYDKGVGTSWYNRLSGGIFGVGLSKNIRQGYTWLVNTYQPNDKIYIVGFSRGAYTARSLVGMIRNCGLVNKSNRSDKSIEDLVKEAYQLYRAKDEGADSPPAKKFRATYSSIIKIHFLGVWDTVGALGIPISSFDWFNQKFYEFHDTELSSIVSNAYHAVAVDEHRENYEATLWDPKVKPDQVLEQQWFSGAHSNVGGGYKTHALSDIALDWLMKKATGCGLEFLDTATPKITKRNVSGKAIDSYEDFLGGLYKITRERYFRPIGITKNGNEAINETVVERCKLLEDYRPRNRVGPETKGLTDPEKGRIRP